MLFPYKDFIVSLMDDNENRGQRAGRWTNLAKGVPNNSGLARVVLGAALGMKKR